MLIADGNRTGAAPRTTPLWALFVLVCVAWYLPFTISARHVGFVADDALYLMMADWFAHGWQDDPVLLYLQSVSHLPPLYSIVLALAGGGSTQVDIAHLVQTLCLIVALLLHGRLAAIITGSTVAGFAVAATLAVMPATLLYSTEIWSEFLFLVLIGAALLAALAARRQPAWWLACGLCIGLAAVTRGAGVVAVIALAGVTVLRARAWSVPAMLLALAPLLAAELLGLGGGRAYVEVFRDRVAGAGSTAAYLAANVDAITNGWLGLFGARDGGGALLMLPAPLALVTLVLRVRRLELDAVYACGYLLLVLIWPFPDVMERLLYPLAPLLLVYAAGSFEAARRHLDPRWRAWLVGVPLVALLSLSGWHGGQLLWHYYERVPPAELAAWRASRYWLTAADEAAALDDIRMRAAIVALLRETASHVPIKSCVYSHYPQAVMFHARRIAWPAEHGAARPAQPNCRYQVVLHRGAERGGPERLWPNAEIVHATGAGRGVAALLVHYPE